MNVSLQTYQKSMHFFVGVFLFSLLVSMAGIEISSGLIMLTLLVAYFHKKNDSSEIINLGYPRLIGLDFPILFIVIAATISLVIHNDYNPNRIHEFTPLRWVFLLYALVYAFQFIGFKMNEVWMERFFLLTATIGLYAFFQANTGVDLVRGDNSAVQFDHFDKFPYFRASGFFSNPMTYGHSSAMWGALVFAFLLNFRSKKWLLLSGFSFVCLLIGLYSCHTRGSWIAIFFGLVTVSFLKKWRLGLSFIVFASFAGVLLAGIFPPFGERVGSIFDFSFSSNLSRLYIWKAHFEIFKDYRWFGSGMNYNPYLLESYYDRLQVPTTYQQIGHAHNTYLQWLAGTGIVGFLAYMSFIVSALYLSIKEYFLTLQSHIFVRTLLLGSIGGQVAFHFGGLTECNFRDAEVKSFFIMLIALVLGVRLQRMKVRTLK